MDEFILAKAAGRIEILLRIFPMGEDLAVLVSGGTRPHIGAAALGLPRQSLRVPEKYGASVSVITVTDHRDDEAARYTAGRLAASLGVAVNAVCGIHVDGLTEEELQDIWKLLDAMLSEAEKALGQRKELKWEG
jgi:hypothetical protein